MVYPFKKALAIADRIVGILTPLTEVIHIAGSIRRLNYEVHDIEVVCVPKKIKVGSVDLFGNDDRKTEIIPEYITAIKSFGKMIKGKPDGRFMQIELAERIMLDLFTPQPVDFWRQFAIRTGSADYSHKVIASGWLRKGWCGTVNGLRLQKECEGKDMGHGKTIWTCVVDQPTIPPVWESEKQFFDWLGIQYLSPQFRTVEELYRK